MIFAFVYKPPTPYRKHACNTDNQLLCNVHIISAKWYWFVPPTVEICSKNTNSGAQITIYGP